MTPATLPPRVPRTAAPHTHSVPGQHVQHRDRGPVTEPSPRELSLWTVRRNLWLQVPTRRQSRTSTVRPGPQENHRREDGTDRQKGAQPPAPGTEGGPATEGSPALPQVRLRATRDGPGGGMGVRRTLMSARLQMVPARSGTTDKITSAFTFQGTILRIPKTPQRAHEQHPERTRASGPVIATGAEDRGCTVG